MNIAIMQPYFFPYLGYIQLLSSVDVFVVYDNIQFTKQSWISRNRILLDGRAHKISLPIQKDSDFLDIDQRNLAGIWKKDRNKMLRVIESAYSKASQFETVYPLIEQIILFEETNLFRFLYHSIVQLADFMEIKTRIIISSEIEIDHSVHYQDRVIAITKSLGGNVYTNPIGGKSLYENNVFNENGLYLKFLRLNSDLTYSQLGHPFMPSLSIIDVLMNNSAHEVKLMLKEFILEEK